MRVRSPSAASSSVSPRWPATTASSWAPRSGSPFAWDRWHAWRSGGTRRPAIQWWAAFACFALFLAVLAPWFARQLAVFGSISPSSASGKVLFIRSIEEWNSITTPANLDWLLSQGLGSLAASRIGGLVAAVVIISVLVGGAALLPFALPAGGRGGDRSTSGRSSRTPASSSPLSKQKT